MVEANLQAIAQEIRKFYRNLVPEDLKPTPEPMGKTLKGRYSV